MRSRHTCRLARRCFGRSPLITLTRPGTIRSTLPRPRLRPETPASSALSGAPALRRDLVAAWPGNRFLTVVSSTAYVDPSCTIGAGTVIAPGAVLTVDVVVGEHCLVNVGATLSHDVYLASFVTVGPGAHLADGCVLATAFSSALARASRTT